MEEKILVLEGGKRWVEYLSEWEGKCLTRSALYNVFRDDPGTVNVFLYASKPGGCTYDELKKKLGDMGAIEKGLDKLLDVGLLKAEWELNKSEKVYDRRFFNRGEISKIFVEFADAGRNRPLDKSLTEYRRELLKRLLLQDIT